MVMQVACKAGVQNGVPAKGTKIGSNTKRGYQKSPPWGVFGPLNFGPLLAVWGPEYSFGPFWTPVIKEG